MRISAIVENINGKTLLDIGTDHGYVLINALKTGRIKRGIAVEIAKKPLEKAKINAKKYQVDHLILFLLSDGFKNVKENYDVVSITGLGYKTIENILLQNHKTPNYYLLGTHSKVERLRNFLSNNNFIIKDEILVYEKHYYVLIKVVRGKEELREEDILLGPILKEKVSSIPYYEEKLNKLNLIIEKRTLKENSEFYIKRNLYLNQIKYLKEKNATE